MKKLVAMILIMVVVIGGFISNAICEMNKLDVYENLVDYIWFNGVKNDFVNAYNLGDEQYTNVYLYNDCLYKFDDSLYISIDDYGLATLVDDNDLRVIADKMEAILRDGGFPLDKVSIQFVGKIGSERIYMVTIASTRNLNTFKNDTFGDGFVSEGITYYKMKCLCRII